VPVAEHGSARGRARLLALGLLALLGCGGVPEPTARNLVLISLDTLRADRLGVYGYARATSPHLDAFASEAFVFERAQSAGNATVGAHHALFQSRPASRAIARKESAPTLAGLLHRHGWRTAGFTDGGTMSRELGFARGFQRFDDGNHGLAESLPKAQAWIDEVAAGSAPFYLFLHSFDVHLPYDPPPPWDEHFGPAYRGPVTGPSTRPLLRGIRRIFEGHSAPPVKLTPADRERVSALYDGEIVKTDALLAPLLARLDAAPLRDDTLVVVLSDHGEEFWEHGSVLHSHTLYQELLHVPLLVRVPAWRGRAHRIAARVSMLDLLPTLLELLDLPPPRDLRGRSLVPLMREPGSVPEPAPILSEGYPFGLNKQSLLAGRFKLIRTLPTGRVELYDLEADPAEQHDLAGARPALRRRMLAVLERELPVAVAAPEDPLARPEQLDPDTRRRLQELGYID
jgi:arylsulfatase A-like enzyme